MCWRSSENLLARYTDWTELTITPVFIFLLALSSIIVEQERNWSQTDRNQLEMAENLVSRFVSTLFWKRSTMIRSKQLEGFNEAKTKIYGLFVAVNNFNDGICLKFLPPLSNFDFLDVKLSSIPKIANDSDYCVLEILLDYADAQINSCGSKVEKVDRNFLSEYQICILDQAGKRRVTTPMLVRTLMRRIITPSLH